MPEPISASTETKATFENRGTQTIEPGDAARGGEAPPEHEQADQPADPDRAGRRGAASRGPATARAATSAPAWPDEARDEQTLRRPRAAHP